MNIGSVILGVIGGVFLFLIVIFILKKFKGSIKITPEKYNYTSGEDITGKIILKLRKPVSSEKLIVGLRCEKTERSHSRKGSHSSTYTLFDFKEPLENEKNYLPSEYSYDFLIKGPNNFSREVKGVAGTLVKSVEILSGVDYSLRWYVYAELQCEGVNLSKKVEIYVD